MFLRHSCRSFQTHSDKHFFWRTSDIFLSCRSCWNTRDYSWDQWPSLHLRHRFPSSEPDLFGFNMVRVFTRFFMFIYRCTENKCVKYFCASIQVTGFPLQVFPAVRRKKDGGGGGVEELFSCFQFSPSPPSFLGGEATSRLLDHGFYYPGA